MDEKTKELIAIGASIGAHCQPCLTYHVARAKELGISMELIHEAVEVGYMVEKGAHSAMREFAKGVLGESVPVAACCCGGAPSKTGNKCC